MSKAWLRDLEEKVKEAAERLETLRDENADLSEKNAQLVDENTRLEQRVTELEEELANAVEGGEAAWSEERQEIRGRVEKLVEHLDTLLSEPSS